MPELQVRSADEELNIPTPSVADQMAIAERQLGAFIAAITALFGSEHATVSADNWIEEFVLVDNLPSSALDWRKIAIAASVRFTSRLNGGRCEATATGLKPLAG